MKPFYRIASVLAQAVITFYQWVISPLLGPSCRYVPSCSAYAKEALRLHGPFHGSRLTIKRILRCHPWGGCGYDPVPPLTQK